MYAFFKLFVIWINKKKVLALLEYLDSEEFQAKEPEHRLILKESIKKARFIMTSYTSLCIVAISGKRNHIIYVL